VDSKVPEMDWPVQSSDLNTLEHLWDELECRLRYRPQCPTSLNALATALQEEWAAILPEMFRHRVESLPCNVHEWEICHRECQITVSSRSPDTFDQISMCIHIYIYIY
jgi:hypothetical protein